MNKQYFLLGFLIAAMAVVASAQGRYANVYSRGDVDGFIRNLEASSDSFAQEFKGAGGTTSSERKTVDRFEGAVDKLRSRFNNLQNWWQGRVSVQDMMTKAREVDVMMRNETYARRLERQWRELRRDINKLADTYELQGLQSGGGSGGYPGPGGGGGGSRPPDWALGTWYWVEGPDRSFSIDRSGTVTENAGRFGQGYWDRGGIMLNGDLSTVTRTSTGIRTYNTRTRETSNYTRDANGGNPGPGGGGNISKPPRWAVGTWAFVQDPRRVLTVEDTGRVILNIAGRISHGTFYEGSITVNGDNSTVERTNNGIRTYNQSTGEYSDYVRRQ